MDKWGRNRNIESKRLYVDSFSVEKWDKLSNAKKDQHTLSNFKGCYHHLPEIHPLFPVKSSRLSSAATENPTLPGAEFEKKNQRNSS